MANASRMVNAWTLILALGWLGTQAQPSQGDVSKSTLRIISHNVWYGFTKVPERKATWLQWMQDQAPDVVSLQELNGYTPAQLAEDAATWGHTYTALLKEDGFPTGITSRHPLEEVQRYTDGFHHGLLRVKIQGMYVYVIHLHPSNWQVRHREVDAILADMQRLNTDARIILAGDFNTFSRKDTADYRHGRLEPFFQARDEAYAEQNLNHMRLDYGVLDKLSAAQMTDTEHHLRTDDYHFTGSFPTSIEKEGEHGDLRRLDYVFISQNLKNSLQKAIIVSDDTTQFLSDHLPVCVDLQFE